MHLATASILLGLAAIAVFATPLMVNSIQSTAETHTIRITSYAWHNYQLQAGENPGAPPGETSSYHGAARVKSWFSPTGRRQRLPASSNHIAVSP
jgi:hypothetical protein